jgi:hypothetical protein
MDETRRHTSKQIASLDDAARVLDADFAQRMRLDAPPPASSKRRPRSRRARPRRPAFSRGGSPPCA